MRPIPQSLDRSRLSPLARARRSARRSSPCTPDSTPRPLLLVPSRELRRCRTTPRTRTRRLPRDRSSARRCLTALLSPSSLRSLGSRAAPFPGQRLPAERTVKAVGRLLPPRPWSCTCPQEGMMGGPHSSLYRLAREPCRFLALTRPMSVTSRHPSQPPAAVWEEVLAGVSSGTQRNTLVTTTTLDRSSFPTVSRTVLACRSLANRTPRYRLLDPR